MARGAWDAWAVGDRGGSGLRLRPGLRRRLRLRLRFRLRLRLRLRLRIRRRLRLRLWGGATSVRGGAVAMTIAPVLFERS